jgi:hypothetical protein
MVTGEGNDIIQNVPLEGTYLRLGDKTLWMRVSNNCHCPAIVVGDTTVSQGDMENFDPNEEIVPITI